MNELVTQQQERGLAISTETKELIQSSIADSTLKRYQRLSKQIEAWLKGAMLTDALRIKSSKTDQEGRGEVLFVGGPTLKLINRYCTRASIACGWCFHACWFLPFSA